jgi:hypothetical protein
VKGGILIDVVVGEGATIFQLLASKDEALLISRDSFLALITTYKKPFIKKSKKK